MGTLIRFCFDTLFARMFALVIAIPFFSEATPPPEPPSTIWYTQIGQWHLRQKDSLSGKSFLFHDSHIDGARSGQATSNVRLNYDVRDIHRCEATLALGPAPSSAGVLVQNKQVTYYFIARKGTASDSLLIYRYCNNRMISLTGATVNISDTTQLKLFIKADSLYFGADRTTIAIAKSPDFSSLTAVGFECPSGSVKVFDVHIKAKNTMVKESFDHALLVNLHLDKLLSGDKKKINETAGR